MANPGVGTKFLSVNLNKSYGQQSHYQYNNTAHSNSFSSSRSRTGGYSNGGSGGMVVLSRPRSSQKAGPKLSVPPPLNLPSLRKEHERCDSSGSTGLHSGSGIPGNRLRPSSSGVGWTKPAAPVSIQDKDSFGGEHVSEVVDHGMLKSDGISNSSVFAPPSARTSATEPSSAVERSIPPAGRASFLRGEDFPSLRATLTTINGSVQRQKEGINQKQNQGLDENFSKEQKDSSRHSTLVEMRPQVQSARHNFVDGYTQDSGLNQDGSRVHEQSRKGEYFPGPLPLVRLSPRSDWADDERDTSHGMADRARDHGHLKSEAFWDRDFDMPRSVFFPQRLGTNNPFSRRGSIGVETGQASSSEFSKPDSNSRDVKTPSNVDSWRAVSPFPRDGSISREMVRDRNGSGVRPERPSSASREAKNENKYIQAAFRESVQDSVGRRDVFYEQGARQPWRNTIDTLSNRGTDGNTRDRSGNGHIKYTADSSQNGSLPRGLFSSGVKGFPLNDPILSFSREKRPLSKVEKPYLEDPFVKGFGDVSFDGRDPFSQTLVGVVKKKKEALKLTVFHDPVRESFEAELERVQKMQEEERRQIVEEQERALELARREEEERLRLVQEQEERQRRLEEEAREAARRAEEERLEALRKAEELRIAKEEEKHRILMEEERRKQAAKQKLLELEEKIAKRQAEAASGGGSSTFMNERSSRVATESEALKLVDAAGWEDSETMVQRTTYASSDSVSVVRPFEMNSGPDFSGGCPSVLADKVKPISSWRRDAFENGKGAVMTHNPENSPHSSWRDRGRGFPKKEFYGITGLMPSRSYYRVGVAEPSPHGDEISNSKGQRWNAPESGNHYGRNSALETDYYDTSGDHGDGWGKSQDFRSHQSSYSVYSENLHENCDGDGYYSSGRTRYSIRQPRVPPPPTLAAIQKAHRGNSHGAETRTEHSSSPSFLKNEMLHNHAVEDEPTSREGYNGSYHASLSRPGVLDVQHNPGNEQQKLDSIPTSRCDSQSSLSVSSPPASPIHLSHDDLDESMDPSMLPASGEDKDVVLSDQDGKHIALSADNGKAASGTVSSADDEDWNINDREQLQEQEEYEEDEDAYQDEEEVHEGDDDLAHDFEEMHIQEDGSSRLMSSLVLGFNEGVEVGIPNDDLERSSVNDDAFTKPHSPLDGMSDDGPSIRPEIPLQANIPASSVYRESEKDMLVNHVENSCSLHISSQQMDNSCSPNISSKQMVSPSVHVASYTPTAQTASAAPSQSELPVKLQFGLFSGPTLIPSPVPAIQIGSIQMPLPLHPHVGQSLTHMQPSQPQVFQFGQLRYTNPVSQGLLSLTPQSVSFVQPSILSTFSVNQNSRTSASMQPGQGSSGNNLVKYSAPENQTNVVARIQGLPQVNTVKNVTPLHEEENPGSILVQQDQDVSYNIGEGELVSQEKSQVNEDLSGSALVSASAGGSEGQPETTAVASQLVSNKIVSRSKTQGKSCGGRGKRFMYAVKRSGSRSVMSTEVSHLESGVYQKRPRRQRTEYRARENAEKTQTSNMVLPNHIPFNNPTNLSGKGAGNRIRSGTQKIFLPNNQSKQNEFGRPGNAKEADLTDLSEKASREELLTKDYKPLNSAEGTFRKAHLSEEDIDVPLQSGVVRIFEQPGIEPPSDDDDFIEVRSKKQMLNDRREQREKQIKARTRVAKVMQKPRSTLQSAGAGAVATKISAVEGELAKKRQSSPSTTEKHYLPNTGASVGLPAPIVSLPLAPIGTPAVKSDAQTERGVQTMRFLHAHPLPTVSGSSSFSFESNTDALDNAQSSSGTWGDSQNNKVVMALTQTQLDEAMKPVSVEAHSQIEDCTKSVSEPSASLPLITSKDKPFSSVSSPVNSLLAGEKIQFGAVTSPTVLPPSSHVTGSHGVGPLVPPRAEHQISRNLPASENKCSLFLEKDKHQNESRAQLQEAEAEAEAAASAVAVAAITSDEVSGNPLGAGPVSVADTKSFSCTDLDGRDRVSHSKADESLSVSLPADLSVETPPISMWPPVASPQNSSHMISHFPGGTPSHFPFYEMNPLLGPPIFAFGPRDEPASNQSQSQNSNVAVSGPHGTWPQCHSGVDSFYGPPAGFSGPFVSPPGGIPGVQGPPHMVVYNHFAPVGQFGQVGLSFMGTTFIPSAKQPDWKHNPVSSAMAGGEGDAKTLKTQQNSLNAPTSVPHLGPRSSLLPIPSPLPMFDVSPFQSSPDMSVQARWSHVPASPLHSVPPSMPLQHQLNGVPHFNHVHGDQSIAASRFSEVRTSSPSVPNRNYPVITDATVTRLPDELGLADASGSSTQAVVTQSTSSSPDANISHSNVGQSNSSGSSAARNSSTAFKPKNTPIQQYGNSSGYDHHRGMGLQKNNSGGEWSHRRLGFPGRNQFAGGEKNFQPVRIKQIYVAKPTSSGTPQASS